MLSWMHEPVDISSNFVLHVPRNPQHLIPKNFCYVMPNPTILIFNGHSGVSHVLLFFGGGTPVIVLTKMFPSFFSCARGFPDFIV